MAESNQNQGSEETSTADTKMLHPPLQEEEASENWWDSLVQTAKDKSTTVFNFMSKDLNEFGITLHNETSSIINSTTATLKETLQLNTEESTASKMKKSMSSFLNSVGQVILLEKEENDDELLVMRNNEPIPMDRIQAKIHKAVINPHTFLAEPEGDEFKWFLTTFDINSKQEDIAHLLVSNIDLMTMYSKLVPDSVSHINFWQRYYFKLYTVKMSFIEQMQKQLDIEEVDSVERPIPADQIDKLLLDYQKECESRASNPLPHPLQSFDKGDFVVVGKALSENPSERTTPISKGSNDEEWVKDFSASDDSEKAKVSPSKKSPGEGDDWESWE